jgi:hypothetical protein
MDGSNWRCDDMSVPRHAGAVVAVIALSGGLIRPAWGQWGLSLDAQRSAFGGTSKDTSSGAHSSARPSRTMAFTLRCSRRWGPITTALGARYGNSDLVVEAPGVSVGLTDEFRFIELLPEVSWRVARTSRGASLELYGGPVLGWWTFEDFSGRFIPGATAGVHGVFPIFDRLAFSLRVGGSLMRTVFQEGELPPEVVFHPMRRSEISLGLRYGR